MSTREYLYIKISTLEKTMNNSKYLLIDLLMSMGCWSVHEADVEVVNDCKEARAQRLKSVFTLR